MLISELGDRTGVPVATLKFYLREDVLQPGELTSRTRADYSEQHVERVRLIRALTEGAGLSLARVQDVVRALNDPSIDGTNLMGHAQRALAEEHTPPASGTALAWASQRGWWVAPDDPLLPALERALDACADGGVEVPAERLDAFADVCEQLARVDVAAVPEDREGAVRQVVVGTVLTDQVLFVLRRLAQQQVASGDAPDCSQPGSRSL